MQLGFVFEIAVHTTIKRNEKMCVSYIYTLTQYVGIFIFIRGRALSSVSADPLCNYGGAIV